MKGSFIKNLHRAFAIGLFLLVLSSVASFFAIRESYRRAEWVQHTEQVKGQLETLSSNLKDAETGVRGYLLTGDSVTLAPFKGSYERVSESFTSIAKLTSDNKNQQAILPELQSLIKTRYEILNQHIDDKKFRNRVDSIRVFRGKTVMDSIRATIKRMQEHEDHLLKRRESIWSSYKNISPLLIIVIAIIGAITAYYFCKQLKTTYYRNVQLQKILQQEKIETDKRIKLIEDIAHQVSLGNYQLRLDEKESDILGSLAASLNRMTSSLEYSFNAINELMAKKDDFISIAAHELKTPLTSIKAYLQFIGRVKLGPDEGRRIYPFVSKANIQVNKLTTIIRDLLDVTRINEGALPLQESEFSIREAILEVFEELFNSIKTHELIIEGEPDICVKADKFRIEQVLINLITNAVKYSPDKNKVIAQVIQLDGFVKVSIRDFGIGIAKEQLPFIFERYFRVEQTSQNFSGLGLGLYISKGIISKHGGEMGVNSTIGEGSFFWFTLPTLCASDRAAT
ncbi:sensor histidine kinase [Desertivirga brevis]|uniref:sensor histidine kinase n=1 Tax=Desertivirga brevis TaxID=2810310 RepID=UPI001A96D34B|nr:CHASE3 domain-containing protein [Pedobacter sp. SYSU D00873]